MLHVAPSTFEVIQLQTERGGLRYADLCARFERLEGLVTLLQERRREPFAQSMQRYQQELIEHGTFAVPSLTSDGVSHAVASLLVADKSVFYAFDNDPDLILGASFLADGFPLAAIVIPSHRVMVNLGDPVWGMGLDHLRALHALSARYPVNAPSQPDPRRVTAVTGDPNFAHYLWNELPAFEVLAAEGARPGEFEILATHQPLGPLRDLFPEAPDWSVISCPDSYLEGRNATDRMFVSLGSFRISRRAQARVERFARARLSAGGGALVERIASTQRPIFWLSIRTRNRTAVNQTAALAALSAAVLGAYPTACIVLDGHSLPADFDTNPSYDRAGTLSIVEADRTVATDVIDQLRAAAAIGDRQDVVAMIGCDILDSIAVASLADVYFCHHGTVQHKIGWLTDVPGMVHCNRRTLALQPARWVADKVENGVEPVYIDAALVEDETPATELSEIDSSLRIECYRFADLERLAEVFLAYARSVVAEGPPSEPPAGGADVALPLENPPASTEPTSNPPSQATLAPSVRDDVRSPSEPHLNGERAAMRAADPSDIILANDFEHADRLTLARELLRVRNELVQMRKAKDVISVELVELAGRLHGAQAAAETAKRVHAELARRDAERDDLQRERDAERDELQRERDAERDELQREIDVLGARLRDGEGELSRRNSVGRRLNDELVRRDLELLDSRAELHESQLQNRALRGELDNSEILGERLLAVVNALHAARAQESASALAAAGAAVAAAAAAVPPPSRLRRTARRALDFVRRLRAAVARRVGAG